MMSFCNLIFIFILLGLTVMLTPIGSGIEPEEVSHLMEVVFKVDEAAREGGFNNARAGLVAEDFLGDSLSLCASVNYGGQI